MVNKQSKKNKILYQILLILIGVIHIIPFYILIGMVFKSPMDLSSRLMMPGYLSFNNLRIAIVEGKVLVGLLNSFIITLFGVGLIVLVGAMAAYPLARNRTKFNGFVMAFILAVMMVPPLSILVPLYKLVVAFKSTSHLYTVILIASTFVLPMSIFLYSNFIDTVPKSIDEAALLDGCSKFKIFYRILLPLLKPVTVTVIILTGRVLWNDYQFSLYFLQRPNVRTLTLAVSAFFSDTQSNMNAAAAAAFIACIPIVLLFLILQKHFIKGATDGAIK